MNYDFISSRNKLYPKNIFLKNIKKKTKKKIVKKCNFNWKYFLILFFISLTTLLFILIYIIIQQKKEIVIYMNYILQLSSKYIFKNKNELLLNQIKKKINYQFTNALLKKLNETYEKNGFININEVESSISEGRNWKKGLNKSKEINVGAGLNENYTLPSMLTIASVMDAQKPETKLRLHFAVVDGFSIENMLKIYNLRERIRDDVEFNFYNAKRVEIDLKGVNLKGNSLCSRLLLPELLPDDVERLIMFDIGDVMVLRDLTEMYNWNMENKTYVGVIDPSLDTHGIISNKTLDIYINAGNYLIDINKVKNKKMYEQFIKHKNAYKSKIADQNLLNDVGYGQIGYMPMKFGIIAPFRTDNKSDTYPFWTEYWYFEKAKYKWKYPFLPKNRNEMNLQAYNPVVIHQFNGKWMDGSGLSIYRRIAQYYIKLAGIWDEMCQKYPGYCYK